MLAYLAVRGSHAGPLFKFSDGRPLPRQRLVTAVRMQRAWTPASIQGTVSASEQPLPLQLEVYSEDLGPVEEPGVS